MRADHVALDAQVVHTVEDARVEVRGPVNLDVGRGAFDRFVDAAPVLRPVERNAPDQHFVFDLQPVDHVLVARHARGDLLRTPVGERGAEHGAQLEAAQFVEEEIQVLELDRTRAVSRSRPRSAGG